MSLKNVCSKSLADFKQQSLLGEGAYSAVYKVVRLADREVYALKKVKLPSLSDKEKQNALNEVRLLASIKHDNIIGYKEAFFDDKTRCLCIVTEYANTGDLFQQITKCQKAREHPKEADVWRFLYGMCHGLKALHDMRILHRDLKCANVFLHTSPGSETVAKLGDFNVSKVAKRGLCMTQTGTPYYASPEVWRDMPYDGKSDMWSLGCVLYEMVALRPPFRAEDMEGLYRKVLRGQYPRIPPHFTNDLSEIIGVLLQVNPRHRPNIDQMLQMPVMRRHASQAEPALHPMDLLGTIKLPNGMNWKNCVNGDGLAGCLPEPQYELNYGYDVPPSQESAGDIAGGTAKQPRAVNALRDKPAHVQPLLPQIHPSVDDGASRPGADGYQDSLDTYISSPAPPDPYSHRSPAPAGPPSQRAAPAAYAPPSLGSQGQYSQGHQGQGQVMPQQSPGPGHLPQLVQDRQPASGREDSLDTYVQRQHRPARERQQRLSSEYGDYGSESQEQRLPRHASPAPSAQRGPPPGYSGQPSHGGQGVQQAYGAQQYRHARPAAERRPMANYARQQYALGSGAPAQQPAQPMPPRQLTGGGGGQPRQPSGNAPVGGGGLRLPRIFTKAS